MNCRAVKVTRLKRLIEGVTSGHAVYLICCMRLEPPITRIDPTCDIFQITSPMPVGVLRLTVLRAKHLIAMDRAIFTEGSSDPYVLVYCGAEVYKSHTVLGPVAQAGDL